MNVAPLGARTSVNPQPSAGMRTRLATSAPRRSGPLLIVLRNILLVVPSPMARSVVATNTRTSVLNGGPEKPTTRAHGRGTKQESGIQDVRTQSQERSMDQAWTARFLSRVAVGH
jgi:hypothetical protein